MASGAEAPPLRALAITSREVTVSWDEIAGVLELKAFAMGPQADGATWLNRVVCLQMMSGRLNAEETPALEQTVNRAVERLAALFPLAAPVGGASLPRKRQRERYSLRTSTEEMWSGRVAFIMPLCGFCVTVESPNDALAWFTIEGAGGTFEAQLWLSTFGLPQKRVTQLETQWHAQMQKILVR
jgi:hypothetical protein